MVEYLRASMCAVFAAGTLAASAPPTSVLDEPWEELPNGIRGRLAIFEGSGGVKIAGYVRQPAGNGPFPIVIVLHGGGPTARTVSADTEPARAEKMAAEAARAGKVLGRAALPPIPDFLREGWAVYTIDYRPNPRYTLDPLEWEDTAVAVRKAREFSFVDPRRVAMFGGSHGGHVTGRMLSRVKLSCAVLCAPGKEAEVYHPENGPHGFYVGLPKPIPETAESTRRAVAFIKRHFESAPP